MRWQLLMTVGLLVLVGCDDPPGEAAAARMLQESGPPTPLETEMNPWTAAAFKGWSDAAIADYANVVRSLEEAVEGSDTARRAEAFVSAKEAVKSLLERLSPDQQKQPAATHLADVLESFATAMELRQKASQSPQADDFALDDNQARMHELAAGIRLKEARLALRHHAARE